uniref:Movement protein n=1 Tax=Steinernema glaseri TaxID=37863 RepID=A0A1I7ZHT5_9BILA
MANPVTALQLADMATVEEAEQADALSPLSGHVTFQRSQSLPQISTERLHRPRTRFLSGRGGGSPYSNLIPTDIRGFL